MRVFNLDADRVGLQMYVDPITEKEKGQLDFKVDTWWVTPVMGRPA